MTKQDFIERLSKEADLDKREAGKAVEAFLDIVTDSLKRGDDVAFTGFGKFTVAQRSERQGVNPQSGERITIKASRVPRFSAGSALKNAVKQG